MQNDANGVYGTNGAFQRRRLSMEIPSESRLILTDYGLPKSVTVSLCCAWISFGVLGDCMKEFEFCRGTAAVSPAGLDVASFLVLVHEQKVLILSIDIG